jgi:hypothetical protein
VCWVRTTGEAHGGSTIRARRAAQELLYTRGRVRCPGVVSMATPCRAWTPPIGRPQNCAQASSPLTQPLGEGRQLGALQRAKSRFGRVTRQRDARLKQCQNPRQRTLRGAPKGLEEACEIVALLED